MNYSDNGRIAIYLTGKDNNYYELTTNLSNEFVFNVDEGFLNEELITDDGQKIINEFKELGLIKYSYGFINYDYGDFELVRFDREKLREYDYKGVLKFEKNLMDLDKELIINPKI